MQSSNLKPKSRALVVRSEEGQGPGKDPRAQFEATAARLLTRLASLDFQCFEHMAADVAVPYMAAGAFRELDHVLLEVLRLSASGSLLWGAMSVEVAMVLKTVESMSNETDDITFGVLAEACDEGHVPQLDNSFVAPLAQWSQDAHQVDAADTAACAARADAVAHAMAHLMRQRARLRLQASLVSKWGMIATGENARRDARFWTRALLVALGFNRPNAKAWHLVGPDLLGEALSVRELLLRFRGDVQASIDLGLSLAEADIGLHLREVDLRILALGNARNYAWVRAKDRFALAGFHARLQTWLAGDWDAFVAARQLLLDLADFIASLEVINNRQVLTVHDQQVQAQALQLLEVHGTQASTARSSPMHELQALLERLRWRSQDLEAFLDHHEELAFEHATSGEVTVRQISDAPLTKQNVVDLTQIVRAALHSVTR